MSASDLHCADPGPRRRTARDRGVNGIDYVEPGDDRRHLTVVFIEAAPSDLDVGNVRVEAPPGARPLRVESVRLHRDYDARRPDAAVRIRFAAPGDLSTYTLELVGTDARGRPTRRPLEGIDPRHASAEFSFAADCPTDLDCLPTDDCPPETFPEPATSYLAKDYASFRRLILDRLALIMPGWTERHVPDLELTLVELLAYVGDYLSYYQDAVATEAYLGTARRRISVRRHARLVDYRMHEGCNARAWVVVSVSSELELAPGDYRFLTGSSVASGAGPALRASAARELPPESYDVFEPMGDGRVTLRPAHDEIEVWTWGEDECCLAAGATRATLEDGWADAAPSEPEEYDEAQEEPPQRERLLSLAPGDVLIFEEVLGPRTGSPSDADPSHRQAVRLTRVTPGYDPVLEQPVVEVEWAPEDALRFPLCLSTVGPDCKPLRRISVARGNVVLVDHGRSLSWCGEKPEQVPIPPAPLGDPECDPCGPPDARRLLEQLLAITETGQELTEEQRKLVVEIVGPYALEAGFASEANGDGPHDGEAKAALERQGLESFLARRGRFPVPYTASLQQHPVTHRVPYPSPELVSAGQARYLESLEELVYRCVLELLRRAQRNEELKLHHLITLDACFGHDALRAADLVGGARANDRGRRSEATAEALGHLLDRWPMLLRRKLERLETLARRARAGYVLGEDARNEIAETWGSQWAEPLAASNPTFDGPACAALEQDPREALAALTLTEGEAGPEWTVRADLLDSDADDRAVVVEVDDEGIAHLRFGDGETGRAVDPGTTLYARYRVGGGTAGNVGAEVISRIVLCKDDPSVIVGVRNPLPACGGVDPESPAEVRLFAPLAFRSRQLRAVTASDYATLAEATPGVQRAAASLRWTGSWYEADVVLDPFGAEETSPQLARRVAERLHRYRRIGHDVHVGGAEYVPIDLQLRICVLPHYQRGEVEKAIRDALGNRTLPGGGRGFFHPDNLTFGGEVALSKIVALVQAIDGVQSVEVLRFERLGQGDRGERARGVLRLGPFEIARLDNDVRRPENGRLTLELGGGR